MNRRSFLTTGASAFAWTALAKPARAQMFRGQIPEGPFQPDWESLKAYQFPDWYRDAKLGIWAHRSPQCVPEDGDWYARKTYEELENSIDRDYRFDGSFFRAANSCRACRRYSASGSAWAHSVRKFR